MVTLLLDTFYVHPAHNVKTTLSRRRFNVLKSLQRPYNVVLTSCAGRAVMMDLLSNTAVHDISSFKIGEVVGADTQLPLQS